MVDRLELERLSRSELTARARASGVAEPERLTRLELLDELAASLSRDDEERARTRGWLGRARDLVASVVEQGLHLPVTARIIRAGVSATPMPATPLATVTLAEIHAQQGHRAKARAILHELLTREPEHEVARALLASLADAVDEPVPLPPEDDVAAASSSAGAAAEATPDAVVAPLAVASAPAGATASPPPPAAGTVTVAPTPEGLRIRWALTPVAWARLSEPRLCVRTLSLEHERVVARDVFLPVPARVGEVLRPGPTRGVAVALGQADERGFEPFVVGRELDAAGLPRGPLARPGA